MWRGWTTRQSQLDNQRAQWSDAFFRAHGYYPTEQEPKPHFTYVVKIICEYCGSRTVEPILWEPGDACDMCGAPIPNPESNGRYPIA